MTCDQNRPPGWADGYIFPAQFPVTQGRSLSCHEQRFELGRGCSADQGHERNCFRRSFFQAFPKTSNIEPQIETVGQLKRKGDFPRHQRTFWEKERLLAGQMGHFCSHDVKPVTDLVS